MNPDVLDVWGEEAGHYLQLERREHGKIRLRVLDGAIGHASAVLGEITVADFRLQRIADFLRPQETTP